jgi:hypothetical protein
MAPVIEDTRRIVAILANFFRREKLVAEFQVLSQGTCTIEVSGYNNWNRETTIHGIYCRVPLELYSNIELEIQGIEQSIKNKAETLFQSYSQSWVDEVVVNQQPSGKLLYIS